MSEWDEQFIILRMGLFHEADLWLRVFGKTLGAQTLFAFGGATSRHRFCGCLDTLNLLQGRIKAGAKSYLCLQEASLVSQPQSLRKDWRKMGIVANCVLFLEALRIPAENAPDTFSLLDNLRMLAPEKSWPALLPFFFRLRLVSMLGFAPGLDVCASCGATVPDQGLFLPAEGQFYCHVCASKRHGADMRMAVKLSATSVAVLKHISSSMPEQWTDNFLEPHEGRACARAIDCFVQYHIGLSWEQGGFRMA